MSLSPEAAVARVHPLEPLRERIARAQQARAVAVDRRAVARQALKEFARLAASDPERRLAELEAVERKMTAVVARVAADREAATAARQSLEASLASMLDPRKWFDAAERRKRVAVRSAAVACDEAMARLVYVRAELEQAEAERAALRAAIDHHRTLDHHALRQAVIAADADAQACETEVTAARDVLRRAEERCASLLRGYADALATWRDRRVRMALAEDLDRRMDADRANRRDYHRQSRDQLGDDSPAAVLRTARRELRGMERDLDKLARRIADEARLAGRVIDLVVLDGSNLCYEGGRFRGLSPLIAAADALAERHRVVVYLDSDIRGRLGLDDRAVARQFDARVRVQVTPSVTKADRFLLEHAQARPGCFIVSNDRFADYPDAEAVAARRLIRHAVADGRVVIPDLDLNVGFR